MNRLFSFWLGPLIAALLVGYVLATWVVRAWTHTQAGEGATVGFTQAVAQRIDVFPLQPAQTPAAKTNAVVVAVDVALVGTILPKAANETARALLRVNGKPTEVAVGQSLPDGTRLTEVTRQFVTLVREGQAQRLGFAKANANAVSNSPGSSSSSASAPAKSTAPPTQIAVASGCPASAEQKNTGIVLNTEMLVGALQNLTALDSMMSVGANGVIVKNSAGIGTLLGLRDGDVIRAVSGARVSQARDLATLALTPLSKAQIVQLDIERGNASQIVTYLPPGCRS